MTDQEMHSRMKSAKGFIAALDQSGGSTPEPCASTALESAYSGEAEMFRLMHEMRVRIITAPAFNGDKVLAAILFERTMDGEARQAGAEVLWGERGSCPSSRSTRGCSPSRTASA